ncbi:hypothetical protein JTE90_004716 [Oedothorax gibbosus]|uniref:Uncharacterized protein n=1 Tax=Oedothorax gibbosus TaxID=931172 RepID=A0AAV6U008_9ARAC|nr:hypothetical protein JTE90_004716 [Oedothorax gibbosus]
MATSFLLVFVVTLAACALTTASYLDRDNPSKCAYKELPCDSGQCVDRKAWCDGPADCFDDSDEKYCRTTQPDDGKGASNINGCDLSRYFQCLNGMCIPKAGRCNDMPDCQDGEDEENCDYLYETEDTSDVTTPTVPPPTTPTTTTTTTTTTTSKPEPVSTRQFLPRGDIPSWLPTRQEVLRKSLRHVIDSRDASWGWGEHTPRVATALLLANESYFETYDGMLTKKQIEVQLALDLMRSSEKPLRMHDLAHYSHALLSSCLDPRDFHGVNVLRLLKKSMSRRLHKHLFVSPLGYLALCNAGEAFTEAHRRRIRNMAYRRSDEPRWLDVQTYALLAISCSASSGDDEWLSLKKDVARNVSDWQQPDGSFGSVHSTALALQALIAAEEPGTEETKGRALAHLLLKQDWQGSYGSELDNYYVLPALNMKSLASLHDRKCDGRAQVHDTQGTEGFRLPSLHERLVGSSELKSGGSRHPTQVVHYSLWLGEDIQTLTLRVPRHSDFLQVMDAAKHINPHFRHEVLSTRQSTSVHAVAGFASDVEKSVYWTLYRRVPLPFRPKLANVTATVAKLKLLGAKRWTKDLHKLHPRDGEHLVFWYKPYL